MLLFTTSALSGTCAIEAERVPEPGQTEWHHAMVDGAERAYAVRRIPARRDEIWAVVTDFGRYGDFMPYVTGSELREQASNPEGERFDVSMSLTTKGIVTHYDVHNRWQVDHARLDFEMVPRRMSPVRSLIGWWDVCETPDDTIVSYTLEARAAWWVPRSITRRAASLGVPRVLETIDRRVHHQRGVTDESS